MKRSGPSKRKTAEPCCEYQRLADAGTLERTFRRAILLYGNFDVEVCDEHRAEWLKIIHNLSAGRDVG